MIIASIREGYPLIMGVSYPIDITNDGVTTKQFFLSSLNTEFSNSKPYINALTTITIYATTAGLNDIITITDGVEQKVINISTSYDGELKYGDNSYITLLNTPYIEPPIEEPPEFILHDDFYVINENEIINSSVALNDIPGEEPTIFALTRDVNHGSLVFNSDGTFIYTPSENFYGSDGFEYSATDSLGQTASATAFITINQAILYFDIIYNLTNCQIFGTQLDSIQEGEDLLVQFEPSLHYALPENIIVSIDEIPTLDYTWTNGLLTISSVSGNLNIQIVSTYVNQIFDITYLLNGVHISGPVIDTILEGETLIVMFESDPGWLLPPNISVNTTYVWSNGVLEIPSVDGNVVIVINATVDAENLRPLYMSNGKLVKNNNNRLISLS